MISSARSTACGFSIFAISGSRVCSRTNSMSSARRTNESATRSTPIFSPVAQVVEVLLGHGRQRGGLAGDVQALARGDGAADLDLRVDLAVAGAGGVDPQPHGAVGEVDRPRPASMASASPAQVMYIRCASPVLVVLAADERDLVARLELGDAVDQRRRCAASGPGRSWRIATGAPGAVGRVAHALRGLGVLLGAAVGEVQAGDVHPGLDHADEDLGLARGGADGRDDLRTAHKRVGP